MLDTLSSLRHLDTWALPLFIFCARICDVTLGTLRMRFVARGYKLAAAAVGFGEVLIWIAAISQLIQSLDRWTGYVAYAGGYAVGTGIGLFLEQRLALGKVMVRAFAHRNQSQLLEMLHRENYTTTSVNAQGTRGPVLIVHTAVPRRAAPHVIELIKEFDQNVFFTIEEVGVVHQGLYPERFTSRNLIPRLPRPGK